MGVERISVFGKISFPIRVPLRLFNDFYALASGRTRFEFRAVHDGHLRPEILFHTGVAEDRL